MTTERCETCRFWDKHSRLAKGYSGNCRAKAPAVSPDDSSAWWPITYNTNWCGEWKLSDDPTFD